MIKVIIADDEARVCNLIRMLIDWEKLDMELVGMAGNGLEALELVKTRQPDILITDIRMPGCHGLELIERAKALLPQLEIVIISGYAHFEYAQTALRFGVGDYLLKPINQQELMGTLKKLGDRCLSRMQLGSEVEQLRRTSAEDKQQLRNRLMQDLLARSLDDASEETLWEKYRFRMQEGYMQLALLRIDYDSEHTSSTTVRIVEEKAAKVLNAELSPVCHTLHIHVKDGLGGVLLGFLPERAEDVRKCLRSCLNQLDAQRDIFGGFAFSMALSGLVSRPEELPQACDLAHALLMERLTQGSGKLLETLPPQTDLRLDELIRPFRQAVAELPDKMSLDALLHAAERLKLDVLSLRHVRGADVFDLVRSAGRLFLQQPQITDNDRKYEQFAARLSHASSQETLFAYLDDVLTTETGLLIEQQRSSETRPIRLAREYMQQHYSEPITLEKVCDEVGFSVSYFSALFKKETGESFVRYLTRIRMDQARELLSQTSLPVSQICVRVGYNDLKHFNQVFKKETELSPGQYRKLYG